MRSFLLKTASLLLILALIYPLKVNAQQQYRNHEQVSERLNELANSYQEYASLSSIAKSPGNRDIWKLTIGSGNIENKPALAIIAGADGSHILGIDLAVKTAEHLLENSADDETRRLLNQHVFYIFPNINPDASEQFFSEMKYERTVNGKDTDFDRDGRISEDPFNDLNGDGLISMMRVEDPTGKWRALEDDPRVMVKADILKGEKGMFHLFTEGKDEDLDGEFNEDPSGGVNINKNFTYQYPAFERGAGEHPVSENENRALLDFLYEAFNVYAVVTFGHTNNLTDPWKFNRQAVSKRVISGPLENDAEIMALVTDEYKKFVSDKNAPNYKLQKGGIVEWGYFHYARPSFGTPAWWIPPPDSGKTDENAEMAFLNWAEGYGVETAFIDWQEVDHPDFPDHKTEVGGIPPFAMTTPPYEMVDSISMAHNKFIMRLTEMRPELTFENVKIENAGRNLTRITLDLHNRGILPTSTELGQRTKWVRPVNVHLEAGGSLEVVSGKRVFQIDRIEGDSSEKISWLIRGKGSIKITAGTPAAGFAELEQDI